MRFDTKGVLLSLLLCVAAAGSALAQESQTTSKGAHATSGEDRGREQKGFEARLLTPSEGLAILGAALDARHYADFPSDCSHLVHELYGRAGFPYEYASSSDLYAGIDEFRRVASPQPGDLAVWRGHAGIVVNPTQHSFFSALSSGLGVDAYDSPYWKQPGGPRFYRYVKPGSSGVLSTSIRTAKLRPTALDKTELRETVADGPVPGGTKESSSDTLSPTKLAENRAVNAEIPQVVVVNSVRPKPDQVGAAFLQTCTAWGESLRGLDLFKPDQFRSDQSLIVFDHFEVKKVHLKGNQGWVEVQIDELVSLTRNKAEVQKRSERHRWALNRRDSQSWELTPWRNTIYLPQHLAAHVLAHELAKLTEDNPENAGVTQEKAELAQLLTALLGK